MDLDSKRRQVAALRTKTVANGASAGEAENAARLADFIEQRYGLTPDPPAPAPGPRPPRPPRARRVILTHVQYRQLRAGQTVAKTQLGVPLRFRIEDGRLYQWGGPDGETRHEILAADMACGNVTVRYA